MRAHTTAGKCWLQLARVYQLTLSLSLCVCVRVCVWCIPALIDWLILWREPREEEAEKDRDRC